MKYLKYPVCFYIIVFKWCHSHALYFLLQLVQEEGGSSLLQSLGHSLRSRERLIQVGEVMRADRTQSCAHGLDPLLWDQSSLECCLSLESLYALKRQCQGCIYLSPFTTLYLKHCNLLCCEITAPQPEFNVTAVDRFIQLTHFSDKCGNQWVVSAL